MTQISPSLARQDALRLDLPRVAALLKDRRASDIGDSAIGELVDLSWLEWMGGTLQLTPTGFNICRQQKEAGR